MSNEEKNPYIKRKQLIVNKEFQFRYMKQILLEYKVIARARMREMLDPRLNNHEPQKYYEFHPMENSKHRARSE